jgi:hypothetical protein
MNPSTKWYSINNKEYTARGRSSRALETLWRHFSLLEDTLFQIRRWCGNVCVTYIRELRSCRELQCKPFPTRTTAIFLNRHFILQCQQVKTFPPVQSHFCVYHAWLVECQHVGRRWQKFKYGTFLRTVWAFDLRYYDESYDIRALILYILLN